MIKKCLILPLLFLVIHCATPSLDSSPYAGWRCKGGSVEGIQYSSLDQITRNNVSQLVEAWVYDTGDADTLNNRSQIQCNSIVINGILYGTSPRLSVFALDAATGKELWRFKPTTENPTLGVNRGVVYWEENQDKRILYTYGEYLLAIDAQTGKVINSFGEGGRVSLKAGLGERAQNLMVISNTPGIIYNHLIIMGSRVHEGPIAAPGHIQAFDVKTGNLVWVFHTIPQPGEYGYETWPEGSWKKIGGANAWSGFSLDQKRGMVYAGTGSASYDFYGGNRKGENLFANCVLALDANTGKRLWHQQLVRHDLWDRDNPATPVLVQVKRKGKIIDAVAQTTKSGHVWVFNRDTGDPLFPVEEIQVPPSDLEGEEAWPVQRLPIAPPPFSRQEFTEDMINALTPEMEKEIKERFFQVRSGGQFVPPSKEGTIIFPGFDGGAEWGGPSFDPETGVLYVNANEMPWILTMVDVRLGEDVWEGIELYRTHCGSCHGLDLQGDGHVPALVEVNKKMTKDSLKKFIYFGKGVMPAFSHLNDSERESITRYVLGEDRDPKEETAYFERHQDIPYSNTGYNRFLTKEGYPAVAPPWGTLSAIDLNVGEIIWQVPLGEYPELTVKGIAITGTENYGGLITTRGGIVVVAATRDEMIRAFDKVDGTLLWEHPLPAGGYASPSTYTVHGEQYIVIACGGGKMGTKSGGKYVAFKLKK